MKVTIIILASMLAMSMAQAKDNFKDEKKLLKCVRKTIDGERINDKAMMELHGIIAAYGITSTEELITACKELKNELKDLPKVTRDQMEAMTDELVLNHAGAVSILKHNIFPSHRCKITGANVDAAFYAGYGVGLGIGSCLGSNGKVWAVVVPTTSFHFGMGLTATVVSYDFVLKRKAKSFNVDNGSLGLGIAIKSGEIVEGVGVGVGLMVGSLHARMLRLVPIGNDFNYGLKQLGIKE